MSLYQCTRCGCCENTALGFYHMANYKSNPPLCSECKTGEWHGKFEKVVLPQGQFKTNRYGNLEHIDTGSTDIKDYQIEAQDD
jgi:hypothetical protein